MGKRRRRCRTSSSTSSSSSSSSTSTTSSGVLEHSDPQVLLGVMLAALSNRELGKPGSEGNQVIHKALDHLLLSLLSKSPNLILHSQRTLHISIISLLPVLLSSRCSEVACSSLEIVGAASLFSIEMNEQIATDEEIVKGLISGVASSRRSVSMAACNALLDLLTTSVGRCRLLEFSAIDNLILFLTIVASCNEKFLRQKTTEEVLYSSNKPKSKGQATEEGGTLREADRKKKMEKVDGSGNNDERGKRVMEGGNGIRCWNVPKSSIPSISLIMEEVGTITCFRIGFTEDEYPILLLHVAITLINECTLGQLRKVPRELSKSLLMYLAKLWTEVHKHILVDAVHESERFFYLSNIRTNNLAESLFRLSMEGVFSIPSKFQEVKRSIFHLDQISFESFGVNHWEESPLLITSPSNALLHDNVFSSFLQHIRSKETVPSFLACLLQNHASALPISSDELDIISFLNEAREHIGCPIIYQQDIRVLKTLDSKGERHFFHRSSDSHGSEVPHFLYAHDVLRCEEAYNDGYTFALRGMEFHFQDIATISEGLAILFGQPSTGVNMYLTPPNSQGLARHRDDHCVLVCQISGVKRWKIFPSPCPRLPRLYEPVDDLLDLESEFELIDGCKEFLLREGDILYIPRGFPHEACTIIDDAKPNGNAEFSLHLTLAIEIEPPFEWEGFVHVALHHWGRNYNLSNRISCESSSWDVDDVAVHLMHIAIKLIGDVDPMFRKACLVGSISFPSEGWLQTHQQSTFNQLLSRINAITSFSDVVSNVEAAIAEHEDPFEKLRWLRHLEQKISSFGMEDLIHLVHEKDKVEAAFMEVKSEFCNGVVFEDVVPHYSMILEKYRRTRKQYINGMLALNCI
ncbi:hypothetical protein L6452_39104 [Arctium lappa]|uniref:Uncharacterized protein n=1 Tax=Arctium lappa TaxID=4217 RepID=A0ACB8XSK8_ARCLA|nr:hypothetical protein L6452_39104 [Arctium lappa]